MGFKKVLMFLFACVILVACAKYATPPRGAWGGYLSGASFSDMTDEARVAKRPVYLGAGGVLVSDSFDKKKTEYGDKAANENAQIIKYMSDLEFALYDGLRKPGISVARSGTDITVILVRDALMQLGAPEFSDTGVDTLGIIAKILEKHNATFIEIAGYTDSMRDAAAARALSLDMAERTAIFFARNKINTQRMFIVGRGAARPIAAQDDIGRLTNRRIELRLTPAR